MAELWDVYDMNRQKTTKVKERGTLSTGEYFLGVEICIFNSKGEMLIQQRQLHKKSWAGLWDISVGGCAICGETSQQAAMRELYEEIGYVKDFVTENKRPFFTLNIQNAFYDFYKIQDDIKLDNLILSSDEVKEVKWATKEEILNLIDHDLFLPYNKGLIEMCFDMVIYDYQFCK
ncbi:NUDIX hydrolase [Anaeromicropila herbilytica]|uniref:NUDIX hydrolase n=1 Tax=Anaeromicropila herbilytica TaxID=2785025 RepID=A0A7R7EI10_9FIRM|nr:NUDIX domain-containing protein [Anaeromicropila herbilytica]BCN29056.1 NUDIX hydrolase [Anaeromicropila herbilytica]